MTFMFQNAAIAALLSISAGVFQSAHAADTGPATEQPTASDRMSTARDAIKVNKWPSAIAELRLAVRDEPKNADAHNLLGYSYRKQAKPDLPKSFEHYNIALKIDPMHKGTHHYIGVAYLMDKKPADADKHLALLEKACGNRSCPEYQDLAKTIATYKTTGSADTSFATY